MTLKIVDWCLWRTLMPKLPMDQYKKGTRGRPTKYDLPDYIPDTPQNVAAAILRTPPKRDREWDSQKAQEANRGG